MSFAREHLMHASAAQVYLMHIKSRKGISVWTYTPNCLSKGT